MYTVLVRSETPQNSKLKFLCTSLVYFPAISSQIGSKTQENYCGFSWLESHPINHHRRKSHEDFKASSPNLSECLLERAITLILAILILFQIFQLAAQCCFYSLRRHIKVLIPKFLLSVFKEVKYPPQKNLKI